jgi:hypothetical protein
MVQMQEVQHYKDCGMHGMVDLSLASCIWILSITVSNYSAIALSFHHFVNGSKATIVGQTCGAISRRYWLQLLLNRNHGERTMNGSLRTRCACMAPGAIGTPTTCLGNKDILRTRTSVPFTVDEAAGRLILSNVLALALLSRRPTQVTHELTDDGQCEYMFKRAARKRHLEGSVRWLLLDTDHWVLILRSVPGSQIRACRVFLHHVKTRIQTETASAASTPA